MKKVRVSLALALVSVIVACGGKVAVDHGGAVGGAGFGGAGGSSSSSTGVVGVGGSSCFNPPDPATLSFCSGGSSGGAFCIENDFCDANGNIWTARCSETGCQCLLNTMLLCDCSGTGSVNYCTGTPTCCPGLHN
jgi:hypothetical protein